MSETVTYKGKITPIASGKGVYDKMREMLSNDGKVFPQGEEELMDYFLNEYYEDYALIENVLYSIHKEDISYDSIFTATKNEDDSYDFVVQFYNGGMCLDEALAAAISNAK